VISGGITVSNTNFSPPVQGRKKSSASTTPHAKPRGEVLHSHRKRNQTKSQNVQNSKRIPTPIHLPPQPNRIQYSSLRTPHSALDTQHSILSTRYSALDTQHSVLRTRYSALRTPNSALSTRYSALSTTPNSSPFISSLAPRHLVRHHNPCITFPRLTIW